MDVRKKEEIQEKRNNKQKIRGQEKAALNLGFQI